MGERLWILFRLASMFVCVGVLRALFQVVLAPLPSVSVFKTVHVSTIVGLSTLAYYAVGKTVHYLLCTPSRAERDRRRLERTKQQYWDMQDEAAATTEVVRGVPKLSMENIWVLVYGLGCVFYTASYCLISLQPACATFLCFGLGFLCVDEVLNPKNGILPLFGVARVVAGGLSLLAVIFVMADRDEDLVGTYVTGLDAFSFVFAVLLPFFSGFLLLFVRDHSRYTTGTTLELCEFGFPFACILGTLYLLVAFGQRFEAPAVVEAVPFDAGNNETWWWYRPIADPKNRTLATRTALDLSYHELGLCTLGPLALVPALVSLMYSVVDSRAVDPLVSVGAAVSVGHLVEIRPGSPYPTYFGWLAVVFVSLAVVVRVLFEPRPEGFDTEMMMHGMQTPVSQLSETVLHTVPE